VARPAATAFARSRTIGEMGEEFTVRAAVPADLEQVAAIYAHYVTTSVATFEEVPPTAADWRKASCCGAAARRHRS